MDRVKETVPVEKFAAMDAMSIQSISYARLNPNLHSALLGREVSIKVGSVSM